MSVDPFMFYFFDLTSPLRTPQPAGGLAGCATRDCPLAGTCRRQVAPSSDRPADRWHWRRDSFGDGVICNGFEPANAKVIGGFGENADA